MPLLEFTVGGSADFPPDEGQSEVENMDGTRASSSNAIWGMKPAMVGKLKCTIINFHEGSDAPLDDDNMVKPIRDAMNGLIYTDDRQITYSETIQVSIDAPVRIRHGALVLLAGYSTGSPFVYVRIDNAPTSSNFPSEAMNSEKELAQVAKQYQDEGYDVILHPKGEAIPSSATGYELDMIAKKGSENAIVAVAANRSAFAARPNLLRLAEVANSQPGWRFDLVVLGSESLLERIAHESVEPSTKQIEALLERAERVATTGDLDAACVYAWAAFEAVMRRTASDLELYRRPLPNELLTTLYSNGLFSMDEFVLLRKAFAMRTRVVHGFLPTGVDPLTVQYTIAAAKKLMMGQEQKVPPAV